jgi:hypothetical protein
LFLFPSQLVLLYSDLLLADLRMACLPVFGNQVVAAGVENLFGFVGLSDGLPVRAALLLLEFAAHGCGFWGMFAC